MKGLLRPLATATVAFVAVLAATSGLLGQAGDPGGSMVAAASTASPTQPPDTSPAVSPSPTKSPSCVDCLSPQDAICWESVCPVPVTSTPPASMPVTIHFATVPISAVPGVDYVGVPDGLMVIQAGATRGDAIITILPNPQRREPRTFIVKFFDPSFGTLVRDEALVTIEPTDQKTGKPPQ